MEIINLKNEYEYIESYNNIQKVISNVYQMSGGWYEIERYGQEPVWVGNKVRVNLYIYLPMEPGSSSVLYHFATPCFRQDVLEYEYLLTEDQIDERNKNLLLIGISDFKKRRTRK